MFKVFKAVSRVEALLERDEAIEVLGGGRKAQQRQALDGGGVELQGAGFGLFGAIQLAVALAAPGLVPVVGREGPLGVKALVDYR